MGFTLYEGMIKSLQHLPPPQRYRFVDGEFVKTELRVKLDTISPTRSEVRVLELYYGMDGEALTLEETGNRLGFCGSRARQIKDKAIRKLHGILCVVGKEEFLEMVKNLTTNIPRK